MSNTLPQNKPKRSLAQKKDVAKISKEFYLKHIEGKVKEKAVCNQKILQLTPMIEHNLVMIFLVAMFSIPGNWG